MYELYHSGVLGMHWGKHKSQTQGFKTVAKSRVSNLNKWGSDPKHNILYITGLSGSGKSTIADDIYKKNKNINVIHLDPFFEKMDKSVSTSIKDKEFVNYLNKNFKEYKYITNSKDIHSKQWWNMVDSFMNHTEKFSEQQYAIHKKVIVEGVQILDDTTYTNKQFFKDKPIIITNTNPLTSYTRAAQRDGRKILVSPKSAKEYIKWYTDSNGNTKKLSEVSGAQIQKGRDFISNLYK